MFANWIDKYCLLQLVVSDRRSMWPVGSLCILDLEVGQRCEEKRGTEAVLQMRWVRQQTQTCILWSVGPDSRERRAFTCRDLKSIHRILRE